MLLEIGRAIGYILIACFILLVFYEIFMLVMEGHYG